MATTELFRHSKPVIAVCSDGTSVFCVGGENRNRIYAYTIAGGAIVEKHRFHSEIVALCTDATYLYIALVGGRIIKWTIADAGATRSELVRFHGNIRSICQTTVGQNVVLYVGLDNGKLFSQTV